MGNFLFGSYKDYGIEMLNIQVFEGGPQIKDMNRCDDVEHGHRHKRGHCESEDDMEYIICSPPKCQ